MTPLWPMSSWIFDLDNSLYPPSCDLFALIDLRMGEYIQRLLDCDPVQARRVRRRISSRTARRSPG